MISCNNQDKLQDRVKVYVRMEVAMNQVDCLEWKERKPGELMGNKSGLVEDKSGLVEDESGLVEDESRLVGENIVSDEDEKIQQKGFLNNQGFGVVEVILLIVIIVALIILFRDKIQEIFEKAMSALTQSTDSILNRVTPAP